MEMGVEGGVKREEFEDERRGFPSIFFHGMVEKGREGEMGRDGRTVKTVLGRSDVSGM